MLCSNNELLHLSNTYSCDCEFSAVCLKSARASLMLHFIFLPVDKYSAVHLLDLVVPLGLSIRVWAGGFLFVLLDYCIGCALV